MNFKVLRVEEDIKRQLSILIPSLKNLSLASKEISIVRVDLSKNRTKAVVYVASLKGFVYARQAIRYLENVCGFLRHEISKNLKLKRVPQLEFVADDFLKYEEHLEELFLKIRKGK